MTEDGHMTTDCPECARSQRSPEGVAATDNLRFSRVVLAKLNGAPDALQLITSEIAGCPGCLLRFADAAVGLCTGQMQTLGAFYIAAEQDKNAPPAPLTERETWDAINAKAIALTEQIVLDATDLENGIEPGKS